MPRSPKSSAGRRWPVGSNGLAPSKDESFLVVAETGARRLIRYRLTGPRAGHAEPFAEDLPGLPDNLWREGPDGPIWVALAGPHVPALDLLHRAAPPVRRAAARLAVRAPYRPAAMAGVLAVDDDGRVRRHLVHRPSGFRMSTSACVADGRLVLGSVWERGIAVCELPDDPG